MRFKTAATTALLGGLVASLAVAPSAFAQSFDDDPIVGTANMYSIAVSETPADASVACTTPDGSDFSTTCPVMYWGGLQYWFLSRSDNDPGWYIAAYDKDVKLIASQYLGGDGRYSGSITVDTDAETVRVTGQAGNSQVFGFAAILGLVAEDLLDTSVSLALPSSTVQDVETSADATVTLDTPSWDPGGQVVVKAADDTVVGQTGVPADHRNGTLTVPLDLSLLDLGSNSLTAEYTPPTGSPLKSSTSTAQSLEVLQTYVVTFLDPDGATLSTERVVSGDAATAPTVTPPTGYLFTGWDTDFSNVTSDLTVRASWDIDPAVDQIELRAFDAAGDEITTVKQGDSITLEVHAFNAGGIDLGDVTGDVVFSSSVSTDVIDGDTITFPHASPHTITAVHTASGATASILIEVSAAEQSTTPELDNAPELSKTGSPGEMSLALLAALLLGSGGLILLRRAAR